MDDLIFLIGVIIMVIGGCAVMSKIALNNFKKQNNIE